jgi:simple sugar transport system substrate-binding protein
MQDQINDATRRALMRAGAFGAAAAGVGTLLGGTARAQGAGGPFPNHPKWRFVFVNHVTTNPFFVPTQYGIEDACTILGCDHQWTGSATSNAAEMVNAMNTAIAGKADAIAVCLVDAQAFNRPIQQALAAGIPVFSYNADAPQSGRLAYIGQELYKAGQLMGERIVQLVPEGDVALFISTPGQSNIQPRIDGAQDAIKQSGKKINASVIATGAIIGDELNAIKAYYLGHQGVKGMFAVDGGSTQSIGQVMRENGLAAKGVKAGGFDLLPLTLQAIDAGHMDFTIDQQPYLQGFYTAIQMFTFLASGGLVGPADTNTGLKFVTKDSVKPYLATKTRFEGDSQTAQVVPRPSSIGGAG